MRKSSLGVLLYCQKFQLWMAALSLFSLAQKIWEFDLAPIVLKLVEFYRTYVHGPVDTIIFALRWLLDQFFIPLPYINPDVVVIYSIFASTMFIMQRKMRPKLSLRLRVLAAVFWPLTAIFGMTEVLAIGTNHGVNEHFPPDNLQLSEDEKEIIRVILNLWSAWFLEILKIVVMFAAVFATNALL